jgi:hypothetical protein
MWAGVNHRSTVGPGVFAATIGNSPPTGGPSTQGPCLWRNYWLQNKRCAAPPTLRASSGTPSRGLFIDRMHAAR